MYKYKLKNIELLRNEMTTPVNLQKVREFFVDINAQSLKK